MVAWLHGLHDLCDLYGFLHHFYLILLQVFRIIFLGFWAWGNGPPPIWKENQQNFEKKEISFFRRIAHILFPWGIGHKREENKKKREREKRKEWGDFPPADLEGSFGRLVYICERRKGENEDFFGSEKFYFWRGGIFFLEERDLR